MDGGRWWDPERGGIPGWGFRRENNLGLRDAGSGAGCQSCLGRALVVVVVVIIGLGLGGQWMLDNFQNSMRPPTPAQVVETSADVSLSPATTVITGRLFVMNGGSSDESELALGIGLPEFTGSNADGQLRDPAVALSSDPGRSNGPCIGPCELSLRSADCSSGCVFKVQLLSSPGPVVVRVRISAGLGSSPGNSLPGDAAVSIKLDAPSS